MAVVIKKGVYVLAGKRTPFGKLGGVLKDVSPPDLFATAAKAAIAASRVDPALIDTVNIGQIINIAPNGLAVRHAALKAGVPRDKPVLSMNKMSASAMQAIIASAQEIIIGSAQISLAGGMEVLSQLPFLLRDLRSGIQVGKQIKLEDMLDAGMYDSYCNLSVLQAADKLAKQYEITRDHLDDYALLSQKRWKAAFDKGIFETEMVPFEGNINGRDIRFPKDENPRPDTTREGLSKLSPVHKGGTTTAGNGCAVNDGAAAVVIASDGAVRENGLTPLARVAAWSCVGSEPSAVGISAASAITALLSATALRSTDLDIVEIHETNAATVWACIKELGLDVSEVNMNSGAIAMGHPSGASGARLVTHLTYELRRRNLKRALAAVSSAGGQGVAILLEAV